MLDSRPPETRAKAKLVFAPEDGLLYCRLLRLPQAQNSFHMGGTVEPDQYGFEKKKSIHRFPSCVS